VTRALKAESRRKGGGGRARAGSSSWSDRWDGALDALGDALVSRGVAGGAVLGVEVGAREAAAALVAGLGGALLLLLLLRTGNGAASIVGFAAGLTTSLVSAAGGWASGVGQRARAAVRFRRRQCVALAWDSTGSLRLTPQLPLLLAVVLAAACLDLAAWLAPALLLLRLAASVGRVPGGIAGLGHGVGRVACAWLPAGAARVVAALAAGLGAAAEAFTRCLPSVPLAAPEGGVFAGFEAQQPPARPGHSAPRANASSGPVFGGGGGGFGFDVGPMIALWGLRRAAAALDSFIAGRSASEDGGNDSDGGGDDDEVRRRNGRGRSERGRGRSEGRHWAVNDARGVGGVPGMDGVDMAGIMGGMGGLGVGMGGGVGGDVGGGPGSGAAHWHNVAAGSSLYGSDGDKEEDNSDSDHGGSDEAFGGIADLD